MKKGFCFLIAFLLLLCFSACDRECEHAYESSITVSAGCIQPGEETFVCVHCEYSYTKEIPALGHSYGSGVTEKKSTCDREGLRTYSCAHCEEVKTETIPMLAHSYQAGEVVQASTCIVPGIRNDVCTGCGHVMPCELPVSEHTFGEETVSKEPNCTEEGEISVYCTVCEASEVVKTIPTNDSHILELTVTKESTCTEKGEGLNTCSLCEYSVSCQFELKEHVYEAQEILAQPTCTKSGTKTLKCNSCGSTREETLPAVGHNWAGATCKDAAVCTACGASGNKAAHTYELVSEDAPSRTFAGQRLEKCKTCDSQILSYFGENYTYDLDAIRAQLGEYAKSLGFGSVSYSGTGASNALNYSFGEGYWVVDAPGNGPDYLIRKGKEHINYLYEWYHEYSADMSLYTCHIEFGYSQSGALGGGFFSFRTEASS